MSGLEPVKMQEGGSPEFLSREGFLSLRDDPERLNIRDITDFIFDPTDPLDIAAAGAAATGLGIPAALGMKGLSTAKKVKKGLGALAGMIPGTMVAREVIDVSSDPVEYTRGIIDLVASVPDAGGAMGDIAEALREDPEGTSAIIYETIRESSGYPMQKRDGGIMQYAEGGDVGMLPPNARTPGGKKKKAVMTVFDLMEDVAEKLPTKATPKTKPKAAPKKTQAEKNREKMQAENQKKIEEANKKRLEESRKAEADAARASTQRSQEAIDKANDVKKADMEGSVGGQEKTPFYKKKRFVLPVAGVTAASLLPMFGQDEKQTVNQVVNNTDPNAIPSDPQLTDRKTTLTFTGPGFKTTGDISDEPQLDQSLMYYMKQDLAEKGFSLDPDTQTFIGDKKPTFFDYVKSLPAGYMDKVADDEDYAKKMMAGFLNMMKPVEGYVPINPFVAFGEGYLGEETRQADMLPADAKLMEYLKKNPGALAKLQSLEATRAGTTVGETKAEDIFAVYQLLKEGLRERQGISLDNIANYDIVYTDPTSGRSTTVDIATFTTTVDDPIGSLSNPNFSLRLKGT